MSARKHTLRMDIESALLVPRDMFSGCPMTENEIESREKLQSLVDRSILALHGALDDVDDKGNVTPAAVKAATYIIDRIGGKAPQAVEISTGRDDDLIAELDPNMVAVSNRLAGMMDDDDGNDD